MKPWLIILIVVILAGILFRHFITPLIADIVNKNVDPSVRAHRQRMRSHLTNLVIIDRKDLDMKKFYKIETEVEVYLMYIQHILSEDKIYPSTMDVLENTSFNIRKDQTYFFFDNTNFPEIPTDKCLYMDLLNPSLSRSLIMEYMGYQDSDNQSAEIPLNKFMTLGGRRNKRN